MRFQVGGCYAFALSSLVFVGKSPVLYFSKFPLGGESDGCMAYWMTYPNSSK